MNGSIAAQPVRPADVERLLLLCADASAREIPRRVGFGAAAAVGMVGILVSAVPLGRLVLWVGALSLLWGASLLIGRTWTASLRNGPAARRLLSRLTAVNVASGVAWGVVFSLPPADPALSDYRIAAAVVLAAVSIGSALRFVTLPRAWVPEVVTMWVVAAVALLLVREEHGVAIVFGGALFSGFVAMQAHRLREVAVEGFQLRLRNESLVMELLGEQDQTREAWARVREQHATLNQVREQLVLAAGRDDLTGVHNRRRFVTEVESAIASLKAGGGHFALVFVDLDHFDDLIERHGPDTGDLALIAVSRALKTTTRGTDAIGRLGGAEFGLLLRGVAEADVAMIGERVTAACRSARVAGQPDLLVTASVGIVTSRSTDELVALLRIADNMMKQARREGRATGAVYMADGAAGTSLVS